MTDAEFLEALQSASNKKVGEDFGFILGTQCPFIDIKGHAPSSLKRGYTVWKKEKGEMKEKDFISKGQISNLSEILSFLNE